MSQKFLSCHLGADFAGSGFYRLFAPFNTLKYTFKNVLNIDSFRLPHDINFYQGINLIRIQRQVSDNQLQVIKFLKAASEVHKFVIAFELDDIPDSNKIPDFNPGKKHFDNPTIQSNIKEILSLVDIVTVTTEILKEELIDSYQVNSEKIIVIPNTIPGWWRGINLDIELVKNRWHNNRRKPRLALPLSSYHFDIHKINDGKDDVSHILNFIRNTVDKYDWIFMGGYCPPSLVSLAKEKKILIAAPIDVLNFLNFMNKLNISAIIAPLEDNKFNCCKSNIKQIEGWSIGVPVIAQNLPVYSQHDDLVFNDENDLQNVLDNILNKKDRYIKTVERNYEKMKDWWLHGENLQKWKTLYENPKEFIKNFSI